MSVRFMLDEQSTMFQEQECSAVQGSGSLTRCVVQKPLPSVARHYLLRYIELSASSSEFPGLPMAPPLGELASEARLRGLYVSPGCGSQRLLRPLVRASHPAGRGPSFASLFPPLAAVGSAPT